MRNYKRKTERGLIPKTVMIQAAKEVLLLKKSNRSVANNYGIPRTTLVRFCSKIEIEDLKNDDLVKINVGYEAMKKVFSFQQEHDLISFINKSRINSNSNSDEGNYHDELTGRQLRKFAYEYAVSLGIKYPSSWSNNTMAGPEWLSAFLRRHQGLNVKRRSHCKQLASNSDACSISTSETGGGAGGSGNIEELNVDTFLDNFKTILDDLKLTHHDLLKMGSNPGIVNSLEITPVVINVEQETSSYLEDKPGCSNQVTDYSNQNEEVDATDQVEEVENLVEDSKGRKRKVEKVEKVESKRGRKKGSLGKKKNNNDGDDQDSDKDFVAKDVKNTPKRTRQSTRLRNRKSEEKHDEKTCKTCMSGVSYVQCNLCEIWVHDKYLSASTIVEVNNKRDILYLCATCQ